MWEDATCFTQSKEAVSEGTQALQDEADAAEAQALQVKQQVEERLMNLAHTVDNFHQKIKQVGMHCTSPVQSHPNVFWLMHCRC